MGQVVSTEVRRSFHIKKVIENAYLSYWWQGELEGELWGVVHELLLLFLRLALVGEGRAGVLGH